MRRRKHLVFLQKFELDGNVAAQSLIFVLLDLILLLRDIDARYGHSVSWSHVQFIQIGSVSVKLQPARGRKTNQTQRKRRGEKRRLTIIDLFSIIG